MRYNWEDAMTSEIWTLFAWGVIVTGGSLGVWFVIENRSDITIIMFIFGVMLLAAALILWFRRRRQ